MDVQVIGVPSERYGEEVVAYIRLRAGEASESEELTSFCTGRIAFHKIPAFFFFVEEYPATASGKIQKYKLREHATGHLKRHGAARIVTA